MATNGREPRLGGESELTGREPMLGGDRVIEWAHVTEPHECEVCEWMRAERWRLMGAFGLSINQLQPGRVSPYSGGVNP